MHNAGSPTLRRSSRVPAAVPILVTSLEGTQFSEVCETMVVNAHGCAILTRVKLDSGVPLHLHTKEGREATAHVVSCQPNDSETRTWRLGAKLDRPQNFWGLKESPKDWASPSVIVQARAPQTLVPTIPMPSHKGPLQPSQPSAAVLDRVARDLQAQVKKMIAEAVGPLQLEISALKEKLSHRESNPSRFEVSLSSIPPELQHQLELRLRNEFGPKVVEEARHQSADLLAAAKSAIEQKTIEAYQQFTARVAEDLKAVEKRAQDLSAHIFDNAREHTRRGLEDFHQQLIDGGNSLKRLSEQLLEFLQQSLNDEHDARRGDLEKLRLRMESESSHLREQMDSLDSRIAKLNGATQAFESGLDERLNQMSSKIVADVRQQLAVEANAMLEELTARSVTTLQRQLDEAADKMKIFQGGIVKSTSQTLKLDAANALQGFGESMERMTTHSVERWRSKLAGGLTAIAKNLSDQLQLNHTTDAGVERITD
jgi:hypothetical protein